MFQWGILLACILSQTSAELEVVNEWNLLNFDLPYNYPSNPNYTTLDTTPTGFEVSSDRIFICMPRFRPGAPTTLAFIPRNKPGTPNNLSPVLMAYPGWEWHRDATAGEAGDDKCTGLLSVFRVRLDRCNRLWVLDSGVLDSLVNFRVACPPKLLIFDLNTNRLVRSITFPSAVRRPNTLLTNFVLDELSDDGDYATCDNTFAYISDTTNPGLIVYDARRDSTWRLQNPAMFPDPAYGRYTLAGEYFTLMDGILGLALSPPGLQRTLYFQPFASNKLFSIATSVLQSGPNPGDDSDLPVSLVGYKSSQAAGLAVDKRDGSLIFAPVSETAIAAWTPGSSDHRVLAHDPDRLAFLLDIRSVDRDLGIIWCISTPLQKFIRRTMTGDQVNFRIMRVLQPTDYYHKQHNKSLFLF